MILHKIWKVKEHTRGNNYKSKMNLNILKESMHTDFYEEKYSGL